MRVLRTAFIIAVLAVFTTAAFHALAQGGAARAGWDETIAQNSNRLLEEGRRIFRFDTFGSEDFWGDQLQLHAAIAGEQQGGVGPGLDASTALQLGLKVDVAALPDAVVEALEQGSIDLGSPATTLELLRANAVIGLQGRFDDDGALTSIGITCALCHATVDDSLAEGVGNRLDGWPNRDLNVGAVIALAPELDPFEEILGVDDATVRSVFESWGPGRFDPLLLVDGQAFRPDGRTAAVLLPAAFGLAGQNLHTYTGFGSVPYWNAYVANTQMQGKGTFFDPRLQDTERFPLVARTGIDDKRDEVDLITPKLAALHYYQLSIPAPEPPPGSFDPEAAARGEAVFNGEAQCATCHVPPLFSEPGWPMHTGEEIGIDNFQANRTPEQRYRTTPLKGLFTRMQGGFYHDGRFPDLAAVVNHYEQLLGLSLTPGERQDLIEYLKSL